MEVSNRTCPLENSRHTESPFSLLPSPFSLLRSLSQLIRSQYNAALYLGSSRMQLGYTTLVPTALFGVTIPSSYTHHLCCTLNGLRNGTLSCFFISRISCSTCIIVHEHDDNTVFVCRVVFNEVIQTSKQYMRDVTVVCEHKSCEPTVFFTQTEKYAGLRGYK